MTNTNASKTVRVLFVDLTGDNEKSIDKFVTYASKSNFMLGTKFQQNTIKNPNNTGFGELISELDNEITVRSVDYVCFVRNTGRIRPQFVQAVRHFDTNQTSVIYYFDEIDSTDSFRKFPVLRPDFSPLRFSHQDYLGSLILVSSDLLNKNAELKFDTFQDLLNALESKRPGTIRHQKTFAFETKFKFPSGNSVSKPELTALESNPLVSIVIPTQGKTNFEDTEPIVIKAVESIVSQSTYQNYEFVIVADAGHDSDLEQRLKHIAGNRLQFVEWNKPFNFSEKMNFGFTYCSGEYLALLNDDVTIISPDWLEQMLFIGMGSNIGLVGAMLYFPDGTIQHAGQAVYRGAPSHIGMGQSRSSNGNEDAFKVPREVTGVTAACALISKADYLRVGGFTSLLPGNFNDVDFCFKIRSLGMDIVITPYAELYHHESITRDSHVHYYELDVIKSRWASLLQNDRYWPGHPYKFERKIRLLDRIIGKGMYWEGKPLGDS